MHKPFILGLRSSQPDAPFMSTEVLFERVGQNSGNLAFHYAVERQLNCNSVVGWDAPSEVIESAGGTAVIPCANQLGAHTDLADLGKKFRSLQTAMVAVGLGAQAGLSGDIPDIKIGTLDWVRAIAERAVGAQPNIGVRGNFTLRVLEHYGLAESAEVLGCPTLFIHPSPELGRQIYERLSEPKRIAVASGNPYIRELARLEASLTSLVKATQGSYVGQHPLIMFRLARGEADHMGVSDLALSRDYICPEMSLDEFALWTKQYGTIFFDIPSWMEHYRRFDFVIGTRIHGTMLALQAGVPALCIAHDSRTLELCQTMKIPYVLSKDVVGGIQRKDLLRLFQFDPDDFDANRRMLARRYVDFLKNNQLQPADWLEGIAAAS